MRDWTFAAGIGRILLSLIFLVSGFSKITGWSAGQAFIASKGLPLPALMLAGAIVVELAAGILLLIGFKARWAALALSLYLVPVTLLFHNFWSFAGPERQMQMINFLKNLALMGGLLQVFVYGAWPMSVERTITRAQNERVVTYERRAA